MAKQQLKAQSSIRKQIGATNLKYISQRVMFVTELKRSYDIFMGIFLSKCIEKYKIYTHT